MLQVTQYAKNFGDHFPALSALAPWDFLHKTDSIVRDKIKTLDADFVIRGEVAIHRSATVEEHVIFKGPAIISAGCFIAAHAYIRGGVYVGARTVIGPGTELKSSIILDQSALAHFNFVGDSIIGSSVNMEAGSVIANHFNERKDKTISILHEGKRQMLEVTKFGAMVGDGCRIGANAVLSPGTLLQPGTVVARLQLIEQ